MTRLILLAALLLPSCTLTQASDAAARHRAWVCKSPENKAAWSALMIAALAKADSILDPDKRAMARIVPLHELDLVASCAKTDVATTGEP